MKWTWRTELPQWLLLGAMFVLAAMKWPTAPDRLPVHWNMAGEVDRFGSKVEGLLLVPLVALGMYVLLLVLPRFDPRRANYEQFAGAYMVLRVALLVFLSGVYWLMLSGMSNFTQILNLMIGALFVVIGSVLGKLRPNWFAGVRTPWTLSSELSWTKTHRLAGYLLMAAGVLVVVTGILASGAAIWVMFATLAVAVVVPIVYSYVVWRSDPDKTPPAGTLPAE